MFYLDKHIESIKKAVITEIQNMVRLEMEKTVFTKKYDKESLRHLPPLTMERFIKGKTKKSCLCKLCNLYKSSICIKIQ